MLRKELVVGKTPVIKKNTLEASLMEEVKDLHDGNLTVLKKDMRREKDPCCSWMGRIGIVK